MRRILDIAKNWRGRPGQTSDKTITLAADRFFQAFREHGVEAAQIPRLLPQVKLDDLQSSERVLAILTPELIDQVAKLFGICVEWLEGCDDRIYECLTTYKRPRILLSHFQQLLHQPSWENKFGTPLRILTTAKGLDYRDKFPYELVPILVEPISTLGDDTIYRYHIYQDGFTWDYPPARIQLKAMVRTIFQQLHRPIPLYPISLEEMEDVLEGRRIPRKFLQHSLITNPSFEYYVLTRVESGVAKETDELPLVLGYMAEHGLDSYDFGAFAPDDDETPETEPASEPTVDDSPQVSKKTGQGKRELTRAIWNKIEAVAKAIWATEQLTIQDMVRRLRTALPLETSRFSDDAIRKHVRRFAPDAIRGKSGRKPKKSG